MQVLAFSKQDQDRGLSLIGLPQDTRKCSLRVLIFHILASRSLARQAPRNAEYHVADLKALPFTDATFNFAFSQSVIEHVVGWEDALVELHRVLKLEGELLIRIENGSVDNRPRVYSLLNYLLFRNRAKIQDPSFRLNGRFRSWRLTARIELRCARDSFGRIATSIAPFWISISHFTTGTRALARLW